jgi:hypothetical protein
MVALEQLVFRDKSLNELFDLEYGEAEGRTCAGGIWHRNKIEDEE